MTKVSKYKSLSDRFIHKLTVRRKLYVVNKIMVYESCFSYAPG